MFFWLLLYVKSFLQDFLDVFIKRTLILFFLLWLFFFFLFFFFLFFFLMFWYFCFLLSTFGIKIIILPSQANDNDERIILPSQASDYNVKRIILMLSLCMVIVTKEITSTISLPIIYHWNNLYSPNWYCSSFSSLVCLIFYWHSKEKICLDHSWVWKG